MNKLTEEQRRLQEKLAGVIFISKDGEKWGTSGIGVEKTLDILSQELALAVKERDKQIIGRIEKLKLLGKENKTGCDFCGEYFEDCTCPTYNQGLDDVINLLKEGN